MRKLKYSGMYDKCGIEIREGDILNCYCPTLADDRTNPEYYHRIVYIKWDKFYYIEGSRTEGISWEMDKKNWKELYEKRVKIIGNIFIKK
jgi:hypothetical protein